MLDKQRNVFVAECDECGVSVELEPDFDSSMIMLRDLDWQVRKKITWLHFCPDCKET